MTDTGSSNSEDTMSAKPGWQTTEFYVTILTAVVPIWTVIFHRDFSGAIQPIAAVAACISTSVYTIARSRSKTHAISATAEWRIAKVNAQSAATATPPSAPPSTPATTVSSEGGLVAVPIETLASILAKLDRLVDEQHRRVTL